MTDTFQKYEQKSQCSVFASASQVEYGKFLNAPHGKK